MDQAEVDMAEIRRGIKEAAISHEAKVKELQVELLEAYRREQETLSGDGVDGKAHKALVSESQSLSLKLEAARRKQDWLRKELEAARGKQDWLRTNLEGVRKARESVLAERDSLSAELVAARAKEDWLRKTLSDTQKLKDKLEVTRKALTEAEARRSEAELRFETLSASRFGSMQLRYWRWRSRKRST